MFSLLMVLSISLLSAASFAIVMLVQLVSLAYVDILIKVLKVTQKRTAS